MSLLVHLSKHHPPAQLFRHSDGLTLFRASQKPCTLDLCNSTRLYRSLEVPKVGVLIREGKIIINKLLFLFYASCTFRYQLQTDHS